MPQRRTVAGVNIIVVLVLVFATFANILAIGNALAARDNCRRIARHNDRTRAVFEESLVQLKSGALNDDYRRIYGPLADEKIKEAKERAERQIATFGPIDCTITIVRWIKGD